MSVPPATGTFTIKSVSQGLAPTGVSPGDTPPDATPVVINGDVTTWNIVQQAGFSIFQFATDDYSYTGVVNGNVVATTDVTQNLNWFARYIESQTAYTIETNDNLGNAWTVSSTGVTNPPIEITAVPTTGSPSEFAPSDSQLFQFYSA